MVLGNPAPLVLRTTHCLGSSATLSYTVTANTGKWYCTPGTVPITCPGRLLHSPAQPCARGRYCAPRQTRSPKPPSGQVLCFPRLQPMGAPQPWNGPCTSAPLGPGSVLSHPCPSHRLHRTTSSSRCLRRPRPSWGQGRHPPHPLKVAQFYAYKKDFIYTC